jgi:superfamily II DNA helicase RecQ
LFRGKEFRSAYLEVPRLRAIFTDVPVLGLTATVTEQLLDETLARLHLAREDVKIVSVLPNRYVIT